MLDMEMYKAPPGGAVAVIPNMFNNQFTEGNGKEEGNGPKKEGKGEFEVLSDWSTCS